MFRIIFLFICHTTASSAKKCYDQSIANGKRVRIERCCADFYEYRGICKECPNGYFGVNCNTRCFYPLYGRLCMNKCNCTEERCNHATGCSAPNQITTTDLKASTAIVGTEVTTLPIDFTSEPNLQLTDAWTGERKNNRSEIFGSVLLYGLPSVLSFLLITTIVLVIRQKVACTCKMKWKVDKQEDMSGTMNRNDEYDMIDESMLSVHPFPGNQHQISRNGEEPDTGEDNARNINDYFQPIADNYEYVDAVQVLISGNNLNPTERDDSKHIQNNIDYLDPILKIGSTATDSDDLDGDVVSVLSNDGYLHPYTTLDPDWGLKTHVYSGHYNSNDGYIYHGQGQRRTHAQNNDIEKSSSHNQIQGNLSKILRNQQCHKDEITTFDQKQSKDKTDESIISNNRKTW